MSDKQPISLDSEGKYAKQIQMTYSAQGVAESSACSKVGSTKLHEEKSLLRSEQPPWEWSEGESETYCMNLSAAPLPQGSLSGRSNVFPNITLSAQIGFRNLPLQPRERERQLFFPSPKKKKERKKRKEIWSKLNTPNLNAPRNTLSLRRTEVRLAFAQTAAAITTIVGRRRR